MSQKGRKELYVVTLSMSLRATPRSEGWSREVADIDQKGRRGEVERRNVWQEVRG
jgi:hypothetical protein